MFHRILDKYVFNSYTVLYLLLFLAACQQNTIVSENNELLTRTNITKTPISSTVESTKTPKSTSTPTVSAIATTTLSPLLPEFTATATSRPTVTPTRTSFSGWLVFSSKRQDTNENGTIDENDGINLYSLDVSSGEMTQLTFGNNRDLDPVWSPNRNQIAFVSDRDGNLELYIMNIGESEVKRLTNTPENEMEPQWSPDGTTLVYTLVKTLDSGLQEKRLYLTSVSGENTKQLTYGPENDFDPDWSPDGRYLVFTRIEEFLKPNGIIYNGTVVYLMDIETKETFRLTPSTVESGQGDFDDPKWLPRDGYFLSMIHQGPGDQSSADIKVFELEWETGQPALYRVFAVADANGRYTWGPNGEWLISIVSNDQYYGEVPNEALNDLILLPIDFSTQRRALTANPAAKSAANSSLYDGELVTNDPFFDDSPDWSP